MPTIDTQLKVAPLPGQSHSRDEYRLPGSHAGAAESNADATGPGAQAHAPPDVRTRAKRRAADKSGGKDPADARAARQADQDAAPHMPKRAAPVRVTGKVFALRDGSGFAALGSDGNYYRVDGGSGHGLAYTRAGGFVDASMVNVAGGPVSAVQLADAQKHPAAGHANAQTPGATPHPAPHAPGTAEHDPDAEPLDPERAASESHATRELIAEHPRTAMRSQANVPPNNAISLLR